MSVSLLSRVPAPLVALPVVLWSGLGLTAAAGGGFAANRAEPAGGGSDWLVLESLSATGAQRASFQAAALGAWRSLVVRDGPEGPAQVLERRWITQLGFSLFLQERFRLDVSLPLALAQTGAAGQVGAATLPPPRRTAVGDLRLGFDVLVRGAAGDPLRVAIGLQVFAPTGRRDGYTSDGFVRVWPRLALAGDQGPIAWAAQLGYHARSDEPCACNPMQGDELTVALAAGVRPIDRLLVGPELVLARSVSAPAASGASRTASEWLLGAHLRVARAWRISAGAGGGLAPGPGSPALRVATSLQYAPWPARAPIAAVPPPAATPAPAPVVAAPPPAEVPATAAPRAAAAIASQPPVSAPAAKPPPVAPAFGSTVVVPPPAKPPAKEVAMKPPAPAAKAPTPAAKPPVQASTPPTPATKPPAAASAPASPSGKPAAASGAIPGAVAPFGRPAGSPVAAATKKPASPPDKAPAPVATKAAPPAPAPPREEPVPARLYPRDLRQ